MLGLKPKAYVIANTKAAWISAMPMYEITWLVMNSVGVVGVMRMRFIMPFSLSCVNDWATIIMRNIDANVNMPGAMKSRADVVFTSTNDAVCTWNGLASLLALTSYSC